MFIPNQHIARICAAKLARFAQLTPAEARGALAQILGFKSWQALTMAMDIMPTSPSDSDLVPGVRALRRDVMQSRMVQLGIPLNENLFDQINPFQRHESAPRLQPLGLPAPTLERIQQLTEDRQRLGAETLSSERIAEELLMRRPPRPAAYFDMLSSFGWDLIDDSFRARFRPGQPNFCVRDPKLGTVPVFLFPSVVTPGDEQNAVLQTFQQIVAHQAQGRAALLIMRWPCWKKLPADARAFAGDGYLTVIGQIYDGSRFHWLPLSHMLCSASGFLDAGVDTSKGLDLKALPVQFIDTHRSCGMAAVAAVLDPDSPERALNSATTCVLRDGWSLMMAPPPK